MILFYQQKMHKTEKNCRPRQQFSFSNIHASIIMPHIFARTVLNPAFFSAVADSELASQIQAKNTKQGFGIQCNSVKIDINIKITFQKQLFTNFFLPLPHYLIQYSSRSFMRPPWIGIFLSYINLNVKFPICISLESFCLLCIINV